MSFIIVLGEAGVPVNIPCKTGAMRDSTTARPCSGSRSRTKCTPVPQTLCAQVYDDGGCEGWKLDIQEVDTLFKWWNPAMFWYRNDIEQVSVRAGCTFTGYEDSSLHGRSMVVRAVNKDRHVELASDAEYMGMDEKIQSVTCTCWD